MRLEYRCLKCGGTKYIVKTIFTPEKSSGLKIDIGSYYAKICLECGFTEFYSAKIVDKDNIELKKKEVKKYVKATT